MNFQISENIEIDCEAQNWEGSASLCCQANEVVCSTIFEPNQEYNLAVGRRGGNRAQHNAPCGIAHFVILFVLLICQLLLLNHFTDL
jgi:hypothetical protein